MTRKQLVIIAATLGCIIGLPLAWYLGSPLFINRTVDEAFPVAQAAPRPPAATGVPADATVRTPLQQTTVPEQPALAATPEPTETIGDTTSTAAPPNEPTPTPVLTEAPMPTSVPPTTVAVEPVALKSGQFHPVEHRGAGDATLYQLANGTRILRLENFDVLNGPDLYVYLSRAEDADDEAPILESGFVSLGRLKGNQGNQNYELPTDLDPGEFHSVSIWCQQFSVNFATAPLR